MNRCMVPLLKICPEIAAFLNSREMCFIFNATYLYEKAQGVPQHGHG